MDHVRFYQRWLFALGLVLAIFGGVMALASGTFLFEPINRLFDPAFWAGAGPDRQAQDFRAWAYGVWGATLAGWGVTIAFLAREAFGRREAWSWRAIAVGTSVWFVFDTGLSIVHGVAVNVLVNVAIAAAVAVPLLKTRADFR